MGAFWLAVMTLQGCGQGNKGDAQAVSINFFTNQACAGSPNLTIKATGAKCEKLAPEGAIIYGNVGCDQLKSGKAQMCVDEQCKSCQTLSDINKPGVCGTSFLGGFSSSDYT